MSSTRQILNLAGRVDKHSSLSFTNEIGQKGLVSLAVNILHQF